MSEYRPTQAQKKRIAMFQHRLDVAKRAHEKQATKWRQWEDIFHGSEELPVAVTENLQSRLQINWVWQHIETIIPRIMDPDPRMVFKPVEPSDERLAHALEVLTKNQLRQDNFVLDEKQMIQDGCVYALSVMKVTWHQRKQKIRKRLPQTLEQIQRGEEQQVVEEEMIVENRPTIRHVDPYDFFWDPKATTDRNWSYVFHRLWLSKAELEAREKQGIYSNVKHACAYEGESGSRSLVETSEEAAARRQDRYAVYEGWFADGTRMVMCGGVLLADGPNPFYHGQIPFVAWNTQPDPRSLVGISEVEKLGPLQQAIWIKDNQRIDAVNYALNTIIIGDPTIPGMRNLKLHPGKVIHAMQGQRIEQWMINPNTAPAFQESENYLAAMQQMSGVNPMLSAGDPSQMNDVTATVGSIAQEEGNKRMAMKKLQFRLAISRVAKMMVQLSHQYLSQYELVRILGEHAADIPAISPEQIPMFLDVEPEAMSEVMGKMAERNSLVELLNLVGPLHGTQMLDGSFFDVKTMIQDTMRSYDRDPSRSFTFQNMAQSMQAPPGQAQAQAPPDNAQMTNDMSQVMQ